MPLESLTFGCRLNAYEFGGDGGARRRGRADRCAARQHLRRDRRGGAPGAAGDPQGAARASRAHASSSPAARRRSTRRRFAAMPEVDLVLGNRREARRPTPIGDVPDFGATAQRRSASTTSCRVRETAAHMVEGLDGRARAFVAGAERLRPSLHLLHHPLRPRQLALRADGRGGRRRSAGWSRTAIARSVLTGVDITAWGADLPGAPAPRHARAQAS